MKRKIIKGILGAFIVCAAFFVFACKQETDSRVDAAGIFLNQTEAALLVTEELTLSAVITPSNTSRKTVAWTSSKPEIASVNEAGVVRGEAAGVAVITASTSNGKIAECSIVVTNAASEADLMVKFGVKSSGYTLNDITPDDVTATFNTVSAYLKTTPSSSSSEAFGVINLGDYVDLESLTVSTNAVASTLSVTNIQTSEGPILRLLVVAINPYYNKNDNGGTQHLIFQFKNLPGKAKMEAAAAVNGYENSGIRQYLINEYWTGLKAAGVPDEVVWEVSRRVSGQNDEVTVIEDKLWLPTEFEMFGNIGEDGYYSGVSENAANQKKFAYYTSSLQRRKYAFDSALSTMVQQKYWEASVSFLVIRRMLTAAPDSYCAVDSLGDPDWNSPAATTVYCAPAFAVSAAP